MSLPFLSSSRSLLSDADLFVFLLLLTRAIYKTVWEISQKTVIDLSADRGAFIDQVRSPSSTRPVFVSNYELTFPSSLRIRLQSQSLNIHLTNPTFGQLTSMHFFGWRRGLKTGMCELSNLSFPFARLPSSSS